MKINRLLEIVTILLNRETVTAKELADRFNVSTRTIYRDIDALSSAGVPVYMSKGNSGGISLLEDYTLNKTMLSKSESEGLLLSLKAMGATSYPEAATVLEKISSVFKGNRTHDWVEVYFEGWCSKVNEQDRFGKIRDAIVSNKVISFDYINGNGIKSNRCAEPVKLIFNAHAWYLIAYCLKRNEHRMFRLSRIKNVQITDKHFDLRKIEEYENQVPHSPLIELKMRCSGKVMYRIYDTFDEDCISKNDDGSFDVTATIPEDEWLYEFILSLGNNAEVILPENIRGIIKTRAKEILDKY
ncbi:MAG: YafY family transcriptional regulator [Oscillospiraceae bacterium]|jgi:predicted DNA-binding transcriptional regulator YafY|nr:YafY family transcriptional regulator [Oscillospiraceae bacterium]